MSRKRRPNSKFTPGSKAYQERQAKLAEIAKRLRAGQSFGDLQGYDSGSRR